MNSDRLVFGVLPAIERQRLEQKHGQLLYAAAVWMPKRAS
jgi:hypothetical protein